MKTETQMTKAGVVAALIVKGYEQAGMFPEALKSTPPAESFSTEEERFAEYLIWDTDFGGAWNDAEQINSALTSEAR